MKTKLIFDWILAGCLAMTGAFFALYQISAMELKEQRRLNLTLFEQSLKLEGMLHKLQHKNPVEIILNNLEESGIERAIEGIDGKTLFYRYNTSDPFPGSVTSESGKVFWLSAKGEWHTNKLKGEFYLNEKWQTWEEFP